MRIGHRRISVDGPPYIIAEIGVNHDGDATRALELVDAAAWAGADAVKVQHFEADRLMSRSAKLAAYQRCAGETDPIAMLRRLELAPDALADVVALAHARGVHAIASVFSFELVGAAAGLPWDAFKSASPDLINRPLLEALAACGRPLIVSTGASTIGEVERAVGWLDSAARRDRLALLQCVSAYPTPMDQAGFGGIAALRSIFHGPVGYSDHTESEQSAAMLARAGVRLFEKHLTHDRAASGPDHGASLEPGAFARYAAAARRAAAETGGTPEPLVGDGEGKRVLEIERDVRAAGRQSLVATRDLSIGDVLREGDMTIKRPGTGIPPHERDSVIGATVRAEVGADCVIPPEAVGHSAGAPVCDGARAGAA